MNRYIMHAKDPDIKDILIVGGSAEDIETLFDNTKIINGGSASGIDE